MFDESFDFSWCLCAHGSAEFFNAKRLFAMNNSEEPWKTLQVGSKGGHSLHLTQLSVQEA